MSNYFQINLSKLNCSVLKKEKSNSRVPGISITSYHITILLSLQIIYISVDNIVLHLLTPI